MPSPSRSAPILTAKTQCRQHHQFEYWSWRISKPQSKKFHFQKLLSENPYEVVKDGSTNPGATGAVEPYVAVSQVDSKTGEDATGGATIAEEVAG